MPLIAGPGQFDGVTTTGDGRILVSSKATGSIHEIVGTRLALLIAHLGDVADIEWDAPRAGVAVPLAGRDRVEFYQLPTR